MAIQIEKKSASQEFLDSQQYTTNSVLRYERIFGKDFVSTGGLETTKEFTSILKLKRGQKVLDVGCGIGGSAFYMALKYGAYVYGIDLSKNMIDIALKKLKEKEENKEDISNTLNNLIKFEICDALIKQFPQNYFDAIYSRDAILHIYDKKALFKRFYEWIKPGGMVLISDYCCGNKPHSKEFEEYVKQRQYHLLTPTEYGQTLHDAGFEKVRVSDRTKEFIDILKKEVNNFKKTKENFIKEFSKDDYDHIVEGWESKILRCSKGDQKWATFIAIKDLSSKSKSKSKPKPKL